MSSLASPLRALAREEWREGCDGLLSVVAAEPGNATAWAYLSGAHLALAEIDQAQLAAERALALDPDGFAPRLKAGELAFRLGDLRTAEDQFVAALRAVEPGTPEAAAARRWLTLVRTRLERAISHGARLPRLRWPGSWPQRTARNGERAG